MCTKIFPFVKILKLKFIYSGIQNAKKINKSNTKFSRPTHTHACIYPHVKILLKKCNIIEINTGEKIYDLPVSIKLSHMGICVCAYIYIYMVSFHSNPKEKQCQQIFKLSQIALISHAKKVMLKILQARLEQYMNQP